MDTQVLTTIIGVAATILAMSVVVQIVQEMYKYFTSSRSRLYVNVLRDHLGDIVELLASKPEFAYLRTRGPFQFLRARPAGRLMPLEAEELRVAVERTAPELVQRTSEQLRRESVAGGGAALPSADWGRFLVKLSSLRSDDAEFETACKIAEFLSKHGHTWVSNKDKVGDVSHDAASPVKFDPKLLLQEIEQTFIPEITKITENSRLIESHLEYATGRRNMRHTVVIGFLLAAIVGLPIQAIYRSAATIPPDKVTEFAESAANMYKAYTEWEESGQEASPTDTGNVGARGSSQETAPVDSSTESTDSAAAAANLTDSSATEGQAIDTAGVESDLLSLIDRITDEYMKSAVPQEMVVLVLSDKWQEKYENVADIILYILGSLGTAILIGFGAPFWNDLLKSLLGLKRTLRPTRSNDKT
ncbi:MAG: hypothetical protein JSU74_12745 [Candidatus Zixiibacteriota bacterium]|nr:MAG: hypothetical protein JSU74_12745 [candidate division Zixibacteria bacterium]